HDPVDALGQRLEQRGVQQTELDAEEAEREADRGEREGDRIPEQQEDDQRAKHQRPDIRGDEGDHRAAPSSGLSTCSATGLSCFSMASGMRPRKMAMRLISSDTP